jgi:hypothetical protein
VVFNSRQKPFASGLIEFVTVEEAVLAVTFCNHFDIYARGQETKNFHIGQVYSVEFESTENFFFWSLPRPVLDFEFNGEDLGRSEQIGPSNISF